MRDLPYWVALSKISSLGARRIIRLVEFFGSAKNAYFADTNALYRTGLPEKVLRVLIHERDKIDPYASVRQLADLGLQAVTLVQESYPFLLKQIYDPPAILYYRGDINVLNGTCVAMVGSRKATEYGKTAAGKIAEGLAAAGVVVVSGMARGIDTVAHQGALQAGGKTVAVLGCGLDICYPPENIKLREKIATYGLLLSEFPPGSQPKPANFPMRNRIISGLSLATVVVEAAEKSGALITADCALEQGRDVFAVPGSIHSPASKGCHRLIKEGAAMVEDVTDILNAMNVEAAVTKENVEQVTVLQLVVLEALEYEPIHFDDICARSGLSAAQLAAVLPELELAGMLKKMPGNYYLRV